MAVVDVLLASFFGAGMFSLAAWATFNYWTDNPMPGWFNGAGKNPFQTFGVMVPAFGVFYILFSGVDSVYNYF